MRSKLFALLVGTLALTVTPVTGVADEPKKGKTVEEIFPTLKGEWQPTEKKPILTMLQLGRYLKKPADFPTEWHLGLVFIVGDAENYYGPAEKVDVDGDGLKITLPPANKDSKRQTRTFTVKRSGENAEVTILDGPFKGTYKLERMPEKKLPGKP